MLRCPQLCQAATRGFVSTRVVPPTTTTFYYNDIFEVELPPAHRFPMRKYRDVRLLLQQEEGLTGRVAFEPSPLATREELETTHCREYISRFMEGNLTPAEVRAVGFPWSKSGTLRALSSVGGTLAATRFVLSSRESGGGRFAAHLAGGTHHAFFDRGEGFCTFSDIAVSANVALMEFGPVVEKVLIIDLDVHQGNGNAKLFAKKPSVFTFSMHCSGNYFSQKETSDVDVELPPGTSDAEYNRILNGWIPFLFDVVKPHLVFFQAGVDIFEGDRLGKLSVTRAGLKTRNELVLEAAHTRNIPLVLTMGGGYPKNDDPDSDNFKEVLECHADCYRALARYRQ